jgi:hypothetical protein
LLERSVTFAKAYDDPLGARFEILEQRNHPADAILAKILNQIRKKSSRGIYTQGSKERWAYDLGLLTAISLAAPYLRRAIRASGSGTDLLKRRIAR